MYSWTYALIPLADLDNELPFRRFDFVVWDDATTSHIEKATFKTASQNSQQAVLGAASDTLQIWKASQLSFGGGEVQALLDLGYPLMPQSEAAQWVTDNVVAVDE